MWTSRPVRKVKRAKKWGRSQKLEPMVTLRRTRKEEPSRRTAKRAFLLSRDSWPVI